MLRAALAEGVAQGLFALASGAAWDAEDSIVHLHVRIDPSEIQFQPGTFMVRASAARSLLAERASGGGPEPEPSVQYAPAGGEGEVRDEEDSPASQPPRAAPYIRRVRLKIEGIPPSRARDVIRVAVLPLSAVSTDLDMTIEIRAEGGITGIPRETLDLVVLEGLRQLGLTEVKLQIDDAGDL